MRVRLALLALPAALLLWLLRPHAPAPRELAIHFGAPGGGLREVDLHFVRAESVVRDVTLFFPAGAPADVTRSVSLAAGDYDVGVRMVFVGGREARLTRGVSVGSEDRVALPLEIQ